MPLTNAGDTVILQSGFDAITQISAGEGTAAFSKSDTALGNEIEAIPVGAITVSGAQVTVEVYASNNQFNPSGTNITEFGFKDSSGTLLYRKVLTSSEYIAKTSAKGLLCTWIFALA